MPSSSSPTSSSSWESISATRRALVQDAIPPQWRLPQGTPPEGQTNVLDIPETCGVLSPEQLEITSLTATELVLKLARGSLSSVTVTEAFCMRAAIAHQLVNCLTDFFPREALTRAAELDHILAKTGKPVGPLHGLPVGVKDTYHMAHKVTTMGFIAWANNHSDTDSTMVSILRSAGAVFYCRNNMPQTGMLLETWNNLFGRTLNPRNTNFSAGGSSGGDAALLALRGAPICPSSDIGGSIRAPAAFNGLYGIRPTADRVPKTGMTTSAPGNVSIKVSCGPNCHSMADIKLLTELILTHASIPFEPTCINVPWRTISKPTHKLSFGILMTDNVVDPHPPIKRALLETAAKLTAQGHEVFEFNPPFDFWEAALITWKLYFQTGAAETKKLVSDAGEPLSPVFQHYLKTYNIKPLTVPELFATNTKQAGYKLQFAQAWTNTQSATSTGRPMDGLICPAGPCAGFPHDFPIWWGYFSIFNLLDYPSIIMPIKDMKIDPIKDAKDQDYRPRDNPFDAENWKIYDADLWKSQPVCLQIVGRPGTDEELIATTERIDEIVNG